MRLAAVTSAATLVLLAAVAPAAATAGHTATGTLVGRTMINAGCPGPAAPGECNPWHTLPHAAFTITRLSSTGAEVARTTRTLRSNSNAAFRIRLKVGSYLVTPTAAANSRAGTSHRLHILARTSTKTTVRFTAKIQPT